MDEPTAPVSTMDPPAAAAQDAPPPEPAPQEPAAQPAPDTERRYVKALLVETRAAPEGSTDAGARVFRFRATTGALDRQGEVVEPTGWETADFLRNPVFLLAHDYRSLPIGKVTALTQDAEGLLADVVFDQEDPNAKLVESKFARGFLNAVSVGFQPLEVAVPKGGDKGPLRHTKKALLEISAVSVPANPDALMVRTLMAVAQRAEHAEAAEAGDAGSERCPDCAAWHALQAAAQAEPTEDLPAAPAAVARGAVWESAAAGMVALLTPGSPDTAADEAWRQRAYHLLERLYRHCGKTPPEFRGAADLAALGLAEFRGLFWEGELAPPSGETRAGRTLSRANEQRIRQIGALAGEVLSTLGEAPQEGAEGGKGADDGSPPPPAEDDALLTMQRLAELLARADGLEALGIDAAARKALAPAAPADDTTAPILDFDGAALAAFAGSGG